MSLPPCTHRPPCPGCPRYGDPGIAASARALLEELAHRSGAVLDEAIEGAATGFRVRARLAVRGRAASPKVGIFQEGSHAIVDIPSCTIHHPRINQAVAAIKQAIRSSGAPPYAERPHTGLVRYVQVVVERGSGRVQVVLVANDDSPNSVEALAASLLQSLGAGLHSLWWNGNAERTNTIFGAAWERLAGEEAVCERIGGADVFFPPGAFGQNNLDLADALVADVQARVADDAVVAELFCGVGAVGLGLVRRVRELRCNEVAREGLRGLELGIAALPAPVRARVVVRGGDAAACGDILDGAETVIVDPPRKGLGPELAATLRDAAPARLLYVSCDAASLSRDADVFTDGAGMKLRRLTPYAMFPHTGHVETIAEFEGRPLRA